MTPQNDMISKPDIYHITISNLHWTQLDNVTISGSTQLERMSEGKLWNLLHKLAKFFNQPIIFSFNNPISQIFSFNHPIHSKVHMRKRWMSIYV